MKCHLLPFALLAATGLAGCATEPSNMPSAESAVESRTVMPASGQPPLGSVGYIPPSVSPTSQKPKFRLTRYLAVAEPSLADDCASPNWPCPSDFENAYTSVEVSTSDIPYQQGNGAGEKQSFFNETGGFWTRAFNPEENTFAFSVDVTINGTGTAADQYLVLTRNDKKGSWSTKIVSSRSVTNFFLVDRNTKISVDFSSSNEKLAEPRFAKLLFQAAENIAAAAVPASKIATVLMSPASDKTKDLIDKTLAGLFSEKNTETIQTGGRIFNRIVGIPQWTTKLYLPTGEDNERALAGAWIVRLTPPRPSIFSATSFSGKDDTPEKKTKTLKAAYAQVEIADILDRQAFTATPRTLREILQSQTWFVDAMAKAVVKGTAKEGVTELCRRTTDTVRKEGITLSPTDEAAVVWAILRQIPQKDFKTADQLSSVECSTVIGHFKRTGLDSRI